MIAVSQLNVSGFLNDSGTEVLVAVHNKEGVQILEKSKCTALKWKQIVLTTPFFEDCSEPGLEARVARVENLLVDPRGWGPGQG